MPSSPCTAALKTILEREFAEPSFSPLPQHFEEISFVLLNLRVSLVWPVYTSANQSRTLARLTQPPLPRSFKSNPPEDLPKIQLLLQDIFNCREKKARRLFVSNVPPPPETSPTGATLCVGSPLPPQIKSGLKKITGPLVALQAWS